MAAATPLTERLSTPLLRICRACSPPETAASAAADHGDAHQDADHGGMPPGLPAIACTSRGAAPISGSCCPDDVITAVLSHVHPSRKKVNPSADYTCHHAADEG